MPAPAIEGMATPIDHAALAEYKMPRPVPGQTVIWHPSGHPTPRVVIATVVEVGPQHCRLASLDQRVFLPDEHICYVEDPRIKSNPHVRKYGSWDFSPSWKAEQERLNTMEETITVLKSAVGDSAVGKLERKIAKLEEAHKEDIKALNLFIKELAKSVTAANKQLSDLRTELGAEAK